MARTNDAIAAEMVARLELTGCEDVLEIGVGPGLGLQRAAAGSRSLAGVDPSPVMLKMATRRVPTADLRLTGVSELPWPACSFDRVCSMNSVMLWPDIPRGIEEIVRVLRPNGRVVIAVRDHSIERKYGGLTRPEIDAVAVNLLHQGLDSSVQHTGAIAYVVADRRRL